jgi:hypothetical protein
MSSFFHLWDRGSVQLNVSHVTSFRHFHPHPPFIPTFPLVKVSLRPSFLDPGYKYLWKTLQISTLRLVLGS